MVPKGQKVHFDFFISLFFSRASFVSEIHGMDAFVIRTPRSISKNNHSASNTKSKVKKGGQRRLNDLRGVVVLEDIQAFVTQLKSSQVASREKVEILKNLQSKQPSTEVIVKTGIGKVVKKLMLKSEDLELAKVSFFKSLLLNFRFLLFHKKSCLKVS